MALLEVRNVHGVFRVQFWEYLTPELLVGDILSLNQPLSIHSILVTDQISRHFWVVGTDSWLKMWLGSWTSWRNKIYGLQLGQLAQLKPFVNEGWK